MLKNSIRTKEGSRKARLLGCWTGQAPRGYLNIRTKEDKRSTLVPSEESDLIVKAFERMASGSYTADEVRRWLNSQGINVSKNQFYNIIRNIAYTGKILIKEYKKEPQMLVQALHPPLISDELFAAANDVLEGRKRNMVFKKDKSDLYYLRGHLYCPEHGRTLSACGSKGRNGIYHYYVCTKPGAKCNRYAIDWAHSQIIDCLNEIQEKAKFIASQKSRIQHLFINEEDAKKKHLKSLEQEKEKQKKQRTKLQEQFMEGNLSPIEYRELKLVVDNKIFNLEERLRFQQEESKPYSDFILNKIPMYATLTDLFNSVDGKTKSKILGSIFLKKLHFESSKVRTAAYTPPIEAISLIFSTLQKPENKQEVFSDLLYNMAPQTGLEPVTL